MGVTTSTFPPGLRQPRARGVQRRCHVLFFRPAGVGQGHDPQRLVRRMAPHAGDGGSSVQESPHCRQQRSGPMSGRPPAPSSKISLSFASNPTARMLQKIRLLDLWRIKARQENWACSSDKLLTYASKVTPGRWL